MLMPNGDVDMSRLERAWSAWLDLGQTDRAQFLRSLREVYAEERKARRVANGTDAAYRAPPDLAAAMAMMDVADLTPPE